MGCALVVRLLGPGAGLGLRAAGHRAAPLWKVGFIACLQRWPNFRSSLEVGVKRALGRESCGAKRFGLETTSSLR